MHHNLKALDMYKKLRRDAPDSKDKKAGISRLLVRCDRSKSDQITHYNNRNIAHDVWMQRNLNGCLTDSL